MNIDMPLALCGIFYCSISAAASNRIWTNDKSGKNKFAGGSLFGYEEHSRRVASYYLPKIGAAFFCKRTTKEDCAVISSLLQFQSSFYQISPHAVQVFNF